MFDDKAHPAFEQASSPRETMTAWTTFVGVAVIVAVMALAVGPSRAPAESSADSPKIGFVPEVPLAVSPIERSIVRGLRRAARKFGVSVQVRTPSPREGYATSFEAFAKEGYDLVVGSAAEGPAVVETARRYPQTQFAIMDVSRTALPQPPPNLTGISFRGQDAGYLVG